MKRKDALPRLETGFVLLLEPRPGLWLVDADTESGSLLLHARRDRPQETAAYLTAQGQVRRTRIYEVAMPYGETTATDWDGASEEARELAREREKVERGMPPPTVVGYLVVVRSPEGPLWGCITDLGEPWLIPPDQEPMAAAVARDTQHTTRNESRVLTVVERAGRTR
jgi:hypothetical protein